MVLSLLLKLLGLFDLKMSVDRVEYLKMFLSLVQRNVSTLSKVEYRSMTTSHITGK